MISAAEKKNYPRLDDLSILFVEDEKNAREVLPRYLSRRGARILSANDGLDGLRLFKKHRPQIIISDVRMPNMDGIAMCHEIRGIDPDIPIIFLSAHNENDLLHSSIELGITRYLTKPVDVGVLMETIFTAVKTQEAKQREVEDLRKTISEAADENDRLNTYVAHFLNAGRNQGHTNIRHLDIPKDKVSGDFFCVAHYENTLYALVADGTGHGLSAVVPVLQVPRIFRAMAAKNYSLLSIADEINRDLRNQGFTGHFLAATLIRMNPKDEFIEVLNFGNPSALLLNREGQILHEFSPNTFALGIVDSEAFSAPVEHYKCARPANLYIFTDGLTDALSNAYPDLDNAGLRKLFDNTSPGLVYDTLKKLVDEAEIQHKLDDVTLVEILFDADNISGDELPPHPLEVLSLDSTADKIQALIGSSTVLLLEDDDSDRNHLEQYLGHRVSMLFTAKNSKEALALFEKHRPQLVIANLGAPLMYKLDLLENIRNIAPALPIIVTGVTCNEEGMERILELGITKFLPKPLSSQKLVCAIGECLQKSSTSASASISKSVFESLPLAVVITNKKKEIIAVNPAFCRITGYSEEEILGRNPSLLSSGKHDPGFYRAMWESINSEGIWSGELWNRRKNGDLYLERVSINTVNDANDEVSHYIATFTDATPTKQ